MTKAKRVRSATTGQYVSKAEAKNNPAGTVSETVKKADNQESLWQEAIKIVFMNAGVKPEDFVPMPEDIIKKVTAAYVIGRKKNKATIIKEEKRDISGPFITG